MSEVHSPSSESINGGPFRTPDEELTVVGVTEDQESRSAANSTGAHLTASNPPRNFWRIAACIGWAFTLGYSDAVPGALLPRIELYYEVNYAVVSLIWIANAIGFIVVAAFSHKLEPWLGKEKALVASSALSSIMYAFVSIGTKFPVTVVGFFFGGLGAGIGVSQTNIFLARFDNKSIYLSYLHGAYGIGATVSPLIATSAVNAGLKWHFFYLTLLGLMMSNIFTFYYSFKGADEDLNKWENEEEGDTNIELTTQTNDANRGIHMISFRNSFRMQPKNKPTDESSNMIAALKSPITWYLCLFVLFYQGAEVAMAGWIVTFLLDYRHGNPSSVGYVASGFWAGLTLGRLGLTKVLHEKVGSRRSVTVISLVSICLVILTWVIPNVIAEAILISFAGVFIGPNYPLMVAFTTTEGLIPRKIQVITMTIMTAFGSSGGAIFPFLVGLLSQTAGTYIILPVFLGLYSAMLILWITLPNLEQRQKKPGIKLTFWQRFW